MMRITWKRSLAIGLAGSLAGCAAKAPPPPPPAPVVVVIPPRPVPPENAAPYLSIPAVDAATGLYHSVNRNITPAQMVWNLRSAYNVAALNCPEQSFGEIVVNYRVFLKANAKALAGFNRKVDAEFRARHGAGFIAPREKYMTEVYNHFALPPTLPAFCAAVMAVSREAGGIKPAELEAFAARSLPAVEGVFDAFYRRYDAYRLALADWTARYGQPPVPVAPGAGPAIQPVAPLGR